MKNRPSRSFVISLLALSTVSATGAWAWSRANSIPPHERAKLGFFQSLLYRDTKLADRSFPTAEDRARNRGATDALIRQLRGEYPALKTEEHPVPEAENGFLQLHRFSKEHETPTSPGAQELKRFLEADRWDPTEAKRLLEQNADLVARIEAIAAMEKRSSTDLPEDFHGYLHARGHLFATQVLLLKARLAAEAHDEPEALRRTRMAFRLGHHLRQVEAPSVMGESVAMLADLWIAHGVFRDVLPALGREANLAQWKEALNSQPYTPAAFAQIMRGEWDNTMRYLVIPVLVDPSSPNRPMDAEQLARLMASHYAAFVTRLPETTLATLRQAPPLAVEDDLQGYSSKSRDLYNVVLVGSENWSKGYLRAATILARYQAALDLLVLERQGATLTRESVSTVSRDPVAEQPFVFDPAARTLTASPASATDPLKLP